MQWYVNNSTVYDILKVISPSQISMNVQLARITVTTNALTPLDHTPVPATLDTGYPVIKGLVMVSNSHCMCTFCVNITMISALICLLFVLFSDINECSEGTDNCDQRCTDTDGSYTCSCNSGYTLAADGQSCTANPVEPDDGCGGQLTASSGSFHSPGYPDGYPQDDFECEWTIEVATGSIIEFTIDDSPFGINDRPPCNTFNDHIEFFDGTGNDANSLRKLCGKAKFYSDFDSLRRINTTSSQAKIVFTGSVKPNRPASRIGVNVDYRTITVAQSEFTHTFVLHYMYYLPHSICTYGLLIISRTKYKIHMAIYSAVNQCGSNNGGCQHNCIDTADGFRCTCNTGYSLHSNGRSCVGELDYTLSFYTCQSFLTCRYK